MYKKGRRPIAHKEGNSHNTVAAKKSSDAPPSSSTKKEGTYNDSMTCCVSATERLTAIEWWTEANAKKTNITWPLYVEQTTVTKQNHRRMMGGLNQPNDLNTTNQKRNETHNAPRPPRPRNENHDADTHGTIQTTCCRVNCQTTQQRRPQQHL